MTLNSLAIFLVDQLLDYLLQELLVGTILFVFSLLSHFKQLIKGAVHVVMVSMLQGLHGYAFHLKFTLSFDSFLIIIKSFGFLLESFLQFFTNGKYVIL